MGKESKFNIPESNNPFLSDILTGIAKRRKSLNYSSSTITLEKVYEVYDDERLEKLEFHIKPGTENSWLQVHFWQDRFVTVNCWERTKQNKWDWWYEGSLLPTFSSKNVIEAIEKTRSKLLSMDSQSTSEFVPIWESMLANGLKRVK